MHRTSILGAKCYNNDSIKFASDPTAARAPSLPLSDWARLSPGVSRSDSESLRLARMTVGSPILSESAQDLSGCKRLACNLHHDDLAAAAAQLSSVEAVLRASPRVGSRLD
eukprot:3236664-Rhodomonas_salina.1